jgi:hypothetical protein
MPEAVLRVMRQPMEAVMQSRAVHDAPSNPRRRVMQIIKTLGLTIAFVLGLSATVSAVDLFGGPLVLDATQPNVLVCQIVNVGERDISVTIEFFDPDGRLLLTPGTFVLGPLQQTARFIPQEAGIARTCKFSGEFSREKVRATAQVFNVTNRTTIAAVEAR